MFASFTMLQLMWTFQTLRVVTLAALAFGGAVRDPRQLSSADVLVARDQDSNKRPSLSLRAAPAVAFAPARILLTAEVRGGPDDFEDLYCPSIEWEWGDGTSSSAQADCAPYSAGRSQIRRRYTVEHIYRSPGSFRVQLRLKKGARITGFANTAIQVRPGLPY